MGVIFEPEIQDDDGLSDDDVHEGAHKTLLKAVSQLYKKQRIDAPKRREAAQEISEFQLSSNTNDRRGRVSVQGLLGELKEKVTHKEINKKVRDAQKTSKTLPTPIEKNQEEKIHRTLGYENVKKKLNKWSTIVDRNRLATELLFPLPEKPIKKEPANFLTTFEKPSELELAMAAVLNQSEIAQEERQMEDELSKLSIEQMVERRNMMAKMRARESYRIAKAVRQNKIKSKKYHRILKRERIKKELLEFEKLQKTNPEAALEKLEQLERARAEERISLRHRNTGKWAKSQAIRAKYDREARIQLSEQLAKSRELTKKLTVNGSSSSDSELEKENSDNEEINDPDQVANPSKTNNPWVNEYKKFLKGYNNFSNKVQSQESEVLGNEISGKELSPNDCSEIILHSENPLDSSKIIESESTEKESQVLEQENLTETPSLSKQCQDIPNSENVETNMIEISSEKVDLNPLEPSNNIHTSEVNLSVNQASKESEITIHRSEVNLSVNQAIKDTDISIHTSEVNLSINQAIKESEISPYIENEKILTHSEHISPKKPKSPVKDSSPNKISEIPPTKRSIKRNRKLEHEHKKSDQIKVLDTSAEEVENIEALEVVNDTSSKGHGEGKQAIKTVVTNCGSWNIIDNSVNCKRKKLNKRKRTHSGRLDDLFDEAESAIQKHASKTVKKIKAKLNSSLKENISRKEVSTGAPKTRIRNDGIDEALIEIHEDGISSGVNDLKSLKEKLDDSVENINEKELQIDPNMHISVKPQKLHAEVGELEEGGDYTDEDEAPQRMHLMEAFADDDIVEKFRQDKKAEAEKDGAQVINLEMPGWGSWGGTSIAPKSKRKKRRFIIKLPKVPRKDEKKDRIIINENLVPKLREKLVSELPYPHTSVKDYEATIRAPLGRNWVPERAHRKLIAPPVRRRMGTIIEPISDPTPVPKKKKNKRIPNI